MFPPAAPDRDGGIVGSTGLFGATDSICATKLKSVVRLSNSKCVTNLDVPLDRYQLAHFLLWISWNSKSLWLFTLWTHLLTMTNLCECHINVVTIPNWQVTGRQMVTWKATTNRSVTTQPVTLEVGNVINILTDCAKAFPYNIDKLIRTFQLFN